MRISFTWDPQQIWSSPRLQDTSTKPRLASVCPQSPGIPETAVTFVKFEKLGRSSEMVILCKMPSLCLLPVLLGVVLSFQFDNNSKVDSIRLQWKKNWFCKLSSLDFIGCSILLLYTQEKAAGLGVNCGCQCSSPSLTFQVCWYWCGFKWWWWCCCLCWWWCSWSIWLSVFFSSSEVLGCCFLFVTYLFYVSFGRRQAVRFHMTPIIYRTVMDNNKGIASGGLFVKGSKW